MVMIDFSFMVAFLLVVAFIAGVVVTLMIIAGINLLLKDDADCPTYEELNTDTQVSRAYCKRNMTAMYDDYKRYRDVMNEDKRRAIEKTLRANGYEIQPQA